MHELELVSQRITSPWSLSFGPCVQQSIYYFRPDHHSKDLQQLQYLPILVYFLLFSYYLGQVWFVEVYNLQTCWSMVKSTSQCYFIWIIFLGLKAEFEAIVRTNCGFSCDLLHYYLSDSLFVSKSLRMLKVILSRSNHQLWPKPWVWYFLWLHSRVILLIHLALPVIYWRNQGRKE